MCVCAKGYSQVVSRIKTCLRSCPHLRRGHPGLVLILAGECKPAFAHLLKTLQELISGLVSVSCIGLTFLVDAFLLKAHLKVTAAVSTSGMCMHSGK